MAGLIKHKLNVQILVDRTRFFCFLPTVYCTEVRAFVVVKYQSLIEIDSGTEAMGVVRSNRGPLLPAGIRNSWTEAQR